LSGRKTYERFDAIVMNLATKTILIWDSESEPPKDIFVVNWRGNSNSDNVYSITKTIEDNSDSLREQYLRHIYDIGNVKVNNKSLIEHLEIERGFSLWWMSLLAEKNYLKSKSIFNCIRLLALRGLFLKFKPKSILLVSADSILPVAIHSLCDSLNISFSLNKKDITSQKWSLKKIRKKIPVLLKAPMFLIYYTFKRWPLRRIKSNYWFSGKNSIFIFSYFIHLNKESCSKGNFFSHQWETLPKLLLSKGINVNWIHHFLFSPVVPNTSTGIKWIKSFNKESNNQGFHQFLDSFLSFKIIIIVLIRWFKCVYISGSINKKLNRQLIKYPIKYLWPFLKEDWKRSIYGDVVMENLIWLSLFDKAIGSIPNQKIGLYLCENQGWERAFIHYWKKYKHGELIAVPHSVIRYWDLRYFNDPKVWISNHTLAQPLPNKIALNGESAWSTYKNANQPMDRMVKVEALRYINIFNKKGKRKKSITKNLLILGDYDREMTARGLHLINSIDKSIILKYKIFFKSHPATPITIEPYNNLEINIINGSLSEILTNMDIVVSTSSTASVIEPFLVGLPTVVIVDYDNLNTSPLRGESKVNFVRSFGDVQKIFKNINFKNDSYKSNNYFWINKELPRWKKILKLNTD